MVAASRRTVRIEKNANLRVAARITILLVNGTLPDCSKARQTAQAKAPRAVCLTTSFSYVADPPDRVGTIIADEQ